MKLKTASKTLAVGAILLMGVMGRPRQACANPDPDFKAAANKEEVNVAMLTDRPLSAGVHTASLPRIRNSETDLDHLIIDVSNPESAIPKYTAENYIGRIKENVVSPDKRSAP